MANFITKDNVDEIARQYDLVNNFDNDFGKHSLPKHIN